MWKKLSKETTSNNVRDSEAADVDEEAEVQAEVKAATKKTAGTKSETPKVNWAKQRPKYSTQPMNIEKRKCHSL